MAATVAKQARNHLQALSVSGRLTQFWRDMYRPKSMPISPSDVLAVLHQSGIRPVLMGTHGLGGWRTGARATEDIDLLVRKKDIGRAVRAIRKAYPALRVKDTPVVTRFIDPESNTTVIDLMKPVQRVFQLVFRHTISAGPTHDIPSLEMALISKFAAMTSPHRLREKKFIDIGDFMNIVRKNRAALNRIKLKRLAEKVYKGGSTEIINLVDDILSGKKIEI